MSLLPAPSSAQDLLEKRRRGRRLELIDQQTLSAPLPIACCLRNVTPNRLFLIRDQSLPSAGVDFLRSYMARCFVLGLLLGLRGNLPPSSFPHLHSAKNSGAKMGEGQFQCGYRYKYTFVLYMPLPQIPCSSAFGRGREGVLYPLCSLACLAGLEYRLEPIRKLTMSLRVFEKQSPKN